MRKTLILSAGFVCCASRIFQCSCNWVLPVLSASFGACGFVKGVWLRERRWSWFSESETPEDPPSSSVGCSREYEGMRGARFPYPLLVYVIFWHYRGRATCSPLFPFPCSYCLFSSARHWLPTSVPPFQIASAMLHPYEQRRSGRAKLEHSARVYVTTRALA